MQTVWSWTVHSYSVNCFTNDFSGELLQIQIPFVGYYRRATMYNVTLGIVFTSCLFLTWIMHFVVLFIQEVSKTQIWGNFHLWKTVLNLPKDYYGHVPLCLMFWCWRAKKEWSLWSLYYVKDIPFEDLNVFRLYPKLLVRQSTEFFWWRDNLTNYDAKNRSFVKSIKRCMNVVGQKLKQ